MKTLPTASDRREGVYSQLDQLSSGDFVLAVGSAFDSSVLHTNAKGRWNAARLRLHMDLLEPFRDAKPGVRVRGRCAVVTSGPPGSGKSFAVEGMVEDLANWRVIDADDFKVSLVKHAFARPGPPYRSMLDRQLMDGRNVMPLELAGLFHRESTLLARRALNLVLARGEDVVIAGTLSWEPLVAEYATALAGAAYESLIVVDLATPREVAMERAKTRWWEGRLRGGMGGRFTPSAAIDSMYDALGRSKCSRNAEDLVEAAQLFDMPAELVSHAPPLEGEDDEASG